MSEAGQRRPQLPVVVALSFNIAVNSFLFIFYRTKVRFLFLFPCLSFVGSLWINKLHLTAPVHRSASRVVGEKILGNKTPKVFPNVDSKAIQTNIHFIGRFPSSSVLLLLQLSFRARLPFTSLSLPPL